MHDDMTTPHPTDDELVLHYYGETSDSAEPRLVSHLAACDTCRRNYTRLQRVMTTFDSLPAPVLPDGFERTVWARLEPALPARRGWLSWFVFTPASLAWAAAIVVLVAGAFFAGRMTQAPAAPAAVADTSPGDQIREGVLLADLGEHLDRSQTMLVELVSADPAGRAVDLTTEREHAEELVAANRLYRQTARESGDIAVSQLLDDLERLLVELATSPDTVSNEDMERVQQRIAAKDLLFKVRVVSSAVRERQKEQIRARSGSGQSS